MGWSSIRASFYYPDGRVDRMKEVESLLTWHDGAERCRPLRSALVGSVVYTAVERTRADGTVIIAGSVILTSITKEAFNFFYKAMSEDVGPNYCDCPKGILDMLTPTENSYALNWREKCRAALRRKAEMQATRQKLSKLPIGSKIELRWNEDEKRILTNMASVKKQVPIWVDTQYRYPYSLIHRCGYTIL